MIGNSIFSEVDYSISWELAGASLAVISSGIRKELFEALIVKLAVEFSSSISGEFGSSRIDSELAEILKEKLASASVVKISAVLNVYWQKHQCGNRQ